jgi:hypothetical protein
MQFWEMHRATIEDSTQVVELIKFKFQPIFDF